MGGYKRLLHFEKRIFFLLVCWDILYLPLAIKYLVNQIHNRGMSMRTIIGFLFHYLLAPANNANGWGPSWYLIAMMIALILFIYLRKLYGKHIILLGMSLGIIEIYYILATEFNFLTHLPDTGVHGFLRVMIYIYLGYIIALKSSKLLKYATAKYWILFSGIIVIFLLENFIVYKLGGISNSQEVITTVPTSWVAALISLKWQPKFTNIEVRQFSTFLYCIQSYPLYVLGKWIITDHLVGQMEMFISVVLIGLVAYIIYKWIWRESKWKVCQYLV